MASSLRADLMALEAPEDVSRLPLLGPFDDFLKLEIPPKRELSGDVRVSVKDDDLGESKLATRDPGTEPRELDNLGDAGEA